MSPIRSKFISVRSFFFCEAVSSYFFSHGQYPSWLQLRRLFAHASRRAAEQMRSNPTCYATKHRPLISV